MARTHEKGRSHDRRQPTARRPGTAPAGLVECPRELERREQPQHRRKPPAAARQRGGFGIPDHSPVRRRAGSSRAGMRPMVNCQPVENLVNNLTIEHYRKLLSDLQSAVAERLEAEKELAACESAEDGPS